VSDYSSYGVGVSNVDYMYQAQNGMMEPNQAYIKYANGEMAVPNETKNLGKRDFSRNFSGTPEDSKSKSMPILTRQGKFVAAVLILGAAAYFLYRSHQAKKAAAGPPPSPAPQEGGTPPIPTEGGEVPEPAAPAKPEPAFTYGPETLDAQLKT